MFRMAAVSVISTMKVERPAGDVVAGADAGVDAVDQARGASAPREQSSRTAP